MRSTAMTWLRTALRTPRRSEAAKRTNASTVSVPHGERPRERTGAPFLHRSKSCSERPLPPSRSTVPALIGPLATSALFLAGSGLRPLRFRASSAEDDDADESDEEVRRRLFGRWIER